MIGRVTATDLPGLDRPVPDSPGVCVSPLDTHPRECDETLRLIFVERSTNLWRGGLSWHVLASALSLECSESSRPDRGHGAEIYLTYTREKGKIGADKAVAVPWNALGIDGTSVYEILVTRSIPPILGGRIP